MSYLTKKKIYTEKDLELKLLDDMEYHFLPRIAALYRGRSKDLLGDLSVPVKLIKNDPSGTSYTDGKQIVLGIHDDDLKDLKKRSDQVLHYLSVVTHEDCHILYTDFPSYTGHIRRFASFMKANPEFDIDKAYPVANTVKQFGEWMNILEDGRIENLLSSVYPGIKSAFIWSNNRDRKNGSISAKFNESQLKDLFEDEEMFLAEYDHVLKNIAVSLKKQFVELIAMGAISIDKMPSEDRFLEIAKNQFGYSVFRSQVWCYSKLRLNMMDRGLLENYGLHKDSFKLFEDIKPLLKSAIFAKSTEHLALDTESIFKEIYQFMSEKLYIEELEELYQKEEDRATSGFPGMPPSSDMSDSDSSDEGESSDGGTSGSMTSEEFESWSKSSDKSEKEVSKTPEDMYEDKTESKDDSGSGSPTSSEEGEENEENSESKGKGSSSDSKNKDEDLDEDSTGSSSDSSDEDSDSDSEGSEGSEASSEEEEGEDSENNSKGSDSDSDESESSSEDSDEDSDEKSDKTSDEESDEDSNESSDEDSDKKSDKTSDEDDSDSLPNESKDKPKEDSKSSDKKTKAELKDEFTDRESDHEFDYENVRVSEAAIEKEMKEIEESLRKIYEDKVEAEEVRIVEDILHELEIQEDEMILPSDVKGKLFYNHKFVLAEPEDSYSDIDFSEIKGLRRELIRLFQERMKRKDPLRNRKRGKLDKRKMTNVKKGKYDVFMKKGQPGEDMDVCISVNGDRSGSMRGPKERHIKIAVSKVEELLKGLVPLKIAGFTFSGGFRDGTTIHFPYREFSDMSNENRTQQKTFSALSGNADADSILVSCEELKKRPEKRKILIMLSDGSPTETTVEDVSKVVKGAEAEGIKVIAIYFSDNPNHSWDTIDERTKNELVTMYGQNVLVLPSDQILSGLVKLLKRELI